MDYAAKRPDVLGRLDGIRYETDPASHSATIVFDRPPLNVVSFAARAQTAALLEEMDRDPAVRVIVIRGANGVYSSGGDIAGFRVPPRDAMVDLAWNVAAPERCRKPVIAAIEKFAMGVAFELALACDFRIATESTQLALPEITLGTIPGSGGTQRVARIAGLGRAKDMIMRGRRIGAREALDWGLVTEVVPDGALDQAVARWVADMAARPQVPLATLKAVLDETYRSSLDAAIRTEGQAFEKLRSGPEFAHGIEAFLAKKKPDFSAM